MVSLFGSALKLGYVQPLESIELGNGEHHTDIALLALNDQRLSAGDIDERGAALNDNTDLSMRQHFRR